MNDYLLLAGYGACFVILLRASVAKKIWWIYILTFGIVSGLLYQCVSLVVSTVGKEALINEGYEPANILCIMIWLSISATVFQCIGMVSCCIFFAKERWKRE